MTARAFIEYPRPGHPPLRIRMFESAVAVVCSGAFILLLLLASHVGEQRRCHELRAHHSPAADYYSCDGAR